MRYLILSIVFTSSTLANAVNFSPFNTFRVHEEVIVCDGSFLDDKEIIAADLFLSVNSGRGAGNECSLRGIVTKIASSHTYVVRALAPFKKFHLSDEGDYVFQDFQEVRETELWSEFIGKFDSMSEFLQ